MPPAGRQKAGAVWRGSNEKRRIHHSSDRRPVYSPCLEESQAAYKCNSNSAVKQYRVCGEFLYGIGSCGIYNFPAILLSRGQPEVVLLLFVVSFRQETENLCFRQRVRAMRICACNRLSLRRYKLMRDTIGAGWRFGRPARSRRVAQWQSAAITWQKSGVRLLPRLYHYAGLASLR